jgi:hypothetical protein
VIFWFKQYLNETNLFSFVQIHSAPVISPIFTLNGENQTRTEQYKNGTEKNQTRTEQYKNGTARALISILPMLGWQDLNCQTWVH